MPLHAAEYCLSAASRLSRMRSPGRGSSTFRTASLRRYRSEVSAIRRWIVAISPVYCMTIPRVLLPIRLQEVSERAPADLLAELDAVAAGRAEVDASIDPGVGILLRSL